MSEENNTFENNGQAQPPYGAAEGPFDSGQPVDLEKGRPLPDNKGQIQPHQSSQPGQYGGDGDSGNGQPNQYNGVERQHQNKEGQVPNPVYQQPYGGQNQHTQTTGYAEPVYQQESQSTMSAESGGFGIASMICGIIALITCCIWCTCIPLAIVSIVLGILQLCKGTAKGMAIAGIICSSIALILLLVLTFAGAVLQNSPAYYDLMRELQYMY